MLKQTCLLNSVVVVFNLFLLLACQSSNPKVAEEAPSPALSSEPEYSENHLDFKRWNWDSASCCSATGKKIAVAGGGPTVAKTGVEISRKGGNVVDVAVASLFVTAVERVQSASIGGGGFMLLHFKNQDFFIDFRETAPRKAKADMYLDAKGQVIPGLSSDGILSVATPGYVAGLYDIHKRWGKLPWRAVVEPAIKLASAGFPVYPALVDRIEMRKAVLLKDPNTAKALFPDGMNGPKIGDTFVQKDLAETLKTIAKRGKKGFYEGAIAKKVAAQVKNLGGILDEKDLKNYQVRMREPIKGTFKDLTFVTAPPESAGGVLLTEMFNVLEPYDLEAESKIPWKYDHWIAEVMKRAYADRSGYIGDPDFVTTPFQKLMAPEYATSLRKSISENRATPSSDIKPGALLPKDTHGTSHLSIMDAEGNAVSATVSNNLGSFGSGVLVPGTGIYLNNTMDDFSTKPGEKNIYGLTGAEANAIAPHKRPVSSMTPTIFFRGGKTVMAIGGGGGARIISNIVNVTLNAFYVFKGNYKKAVFAPRVHHQWLPDKLDLESSISDATKAKLKTMGYEIGTPSFSGEVEVVGVDEKGQLMAVFDPRNQGGAAAR
jgi:gamma-glutamyltranspeptidase / glutathione hydrolase